MQDTTNNHLDVAQTQKTIYPIFIVSDSIQKDTNIVGFKDYVVRTLNCHTEPLIERESLFGKKTYVNKDLKMLERPNTSAEGWIYGVIFLAAIFYLLLIKIFSNKIKHVIRGTYSHLTLFIILSFLFIPVFALLCYTPISQYNYYYYFPIKSHFAIFLLLYFIILTYALIKYILIFFFGELFRARSICFNYNSNQLGFYFISGIIMIPFLFFYYYSPNSAKDNILIAILIVFSILLLTRLVKGLLLVLSETKFSKFYLFVYLCILEFIPLIIIYKSLIDY
ncbi:MAG TPA: DUF4271 domain-containing protein [Bacteroidales bacterium]|nr:DUF4271 domain-containing protein [Bacteroidales bacterium]